MKIHPIDVKREEAWIDLRDFFKTTDGILLLSSLGAMSLVFAWHDFVTTMVAVPIVGACLFLLWLLFWKTYAVLYSFWVFTKSIRIPAAKIAVNRMALAKAVVGLYLMFVAASLFHVPWEGWTNAPIVPGSTYYKWQKVVRHGNIFYAPSGLRGSNPAQNYFSTNGPRPILRLNQTTTLWLVGGIFTVGLVWLLIGARIRPQETKPNSD